LNDRQIKELDRFEQSDAYNDLEKDVLRYADQATRQCKVAGNVMERLAKQLTPSQLVILAATVGLANWTNRFNESIAVELP
jgi:alkylhydroperoxidase family enzyme